MVKLRWTNDTTFVDRDNNFRAEGEGVYDVDDELAEEYLAHRSGGWVEADDDADAQDDSADDDEDAPTALSTEEFHDMGYQERADAVRSGEVDSLLDDIEEDETAQTVQNAIADRREELGSDADADADTDEDDSADSQAVSEGEGASFAGGRDDYSEDEDTALDEERLEDEDADSESENDGDGEE